MGDYLNFIDGLLARLQGPMSFRFLIQPLMALIFAFRDGRRDAREGRPPYFWGLFTDSQDRADMFRSGWKSVSKVFILAIILDIVFQFIVFHEFRFGAGLIAGVVLAIIPYLAFRGPINRLMRHRIEERKSNGRQNQ